MNINRRVPAKSRSPSPAHHWMAGWSVMPGMGPVMCRLPPRLCSARSNAAAAAELGVMTALPERVLSSAAPKEPLSWMDSASATCRRRGI